MSSTVSERWGDIPFPPLQIPLQITPRGALENIKFPEYIPPLAERNWETDSQGWN